MIGHALVLWIMTVGPVHLRSGEKIAADRVAGVSAQGVELKPAFDNAALSGVKVVPWSDVLTIENGWAGAEPFRPLADSINRAEGRLGRGDFAGAGTIIEPLSTEHLSLRGPTSGAIASSLTMVRVLRSDPAGAAVAWLAWRSSPAGPARAWIDPETGLCPSLPPVWSEPQARDFLAEDLAGLGLEQPAGMLAALYANAAHAALGGEAEPAPDADSRSKSDPGVRLVVEILRAQTETDPTSLAAARDALRRRVRAGGPPWQDAWCRLGLGVSALREDDRLEADAGAGELVAVLLEHRLTAPGLTDVARQRLIDYFHRTARPEHARAVEAMDHAALSGIRTRATSAADPSSNEETP